MEVDNTVLTDAANPANNFFNSQDTIDGAECGASPPTLPCDTSRNPDYSNMMGWDLVQVAAPGAIPNGATSATVSVSTNGDTYYPTAITTQIDNYAPDFASPAKSVVDLEGNNPAKVGDTLRYTLEFTNIGGDAAGDVVLHDSIPTGTTYVPGSINLLTGANAGANPPRQLTDAAGDDQGEFDSGPSPRCPRWWCASAPEPTPRAEGRSTPAPTRTTRPAFRSRSPSTARPPVPLLPIPARSTTPRPRSVRLPTTPTRSTLRWRARPTSQ